MKILVVGLGSMGQRRIRLLKKVKPEAVIVGVDSDQERMRIIGNKLKIATCSELGEALRDSEVQCAVISTSPGSHAGIIQKCLESNLHVFTELNLVSTGYNDNIKLAEEKKKKLFLSSTFLYRNEIRYIMGKMQKQTGNVNYCYHVGQYLPDWHPWESYEDFFVREKETNGCRELFAIELPWLIKTFGEIESIKVLAGNSTSLKISYYDNYLTLIQHKTGHKGMLAIDIVSRKAVRNLEIFGEEMYITWDGVPAGLKEYDFRKKEERVVKLYDSVDSIKGYEAFIVENAYENELRKFFNEIECDDKSIYSLKEDEATLAWIDYIEKHAERKV